MEGHHQEWSLRLNLTQHGAAYWVWTWRVSTDLSWFCRWWCMAILNWWRGLSGWFREKKRPCSLRLDKLVLLSGCPLLRGTEVLSVSSHVPAGREAWPCKGIQAWDRQMQFSVSNMEFLVGTGHQLVLITSLPVVHISLCYYRWNGLVRPSELTHDVSCVDRSNSIIWREWKW